MIRVRVTIIRIFVLLGFTAGCATEPLSPVNNPNSAIAAIVDVVPKEVEILKDSCLGASTETKNLIKKRLAETYEAQDIALADVKIKSFNKVRGTHECKISRTATDSETFECTNVELSSYSSPPEIAILGMYEICYGEDFLDHDLIDKYAGKYADGSSVIYGFPSWQESSSRNWRYLIIPQSESELHKIRLGDVVDVKGKIAGIGSTYYEAERLDFDYIIIVNAVLDTADN